MKTQSENPIGPTRPGESELRAENEVLKIKLKLEYGMDIDENSSLPPEAENKWLNYIYNFEKQYKEAKRIKVYDRIGRPDFIKAADLKQGEVEIELPRLVSLMQEKAVELDCCAEYDKAVIYRFITEELFEHEMDDITIGGFVQHFIYEEFHPNHDHDLRRYTDQFIDLVLRRRLTEYDSHRFSHGVWFKGKKYDKAGIMSIIELFQESRQVTQVDQFEIQEVTINEEEGHAEVRVLIGYASAASDLSHCQGLATLHFVLEYNYWYISGFQMPGFGTN